MLGVQAVSVVADGARPLRAHGVIADIPGCAILSFADRGVSQQITRYFASDSLIASAKCVNPSANSLVVGFSVVLATSGNLLAALMAHCAELVTGGECIGGNGQRLSPLS